MKKLIVIVSILFTINCKGQDTTFVSNLRTQDTTFFVKNNVVFMTIKNVVPVTDEITYQKFLTDKKKKRKSNRIVNSIGFGIFIIGNLLIGLSMSK